ncbi:MAG: DUF3426 domain-containing protein [Desulfobacterales bacterium]
MIITCENCATGFNLAEEMLNPAGSKVRCSKCGHIFTAYPSQAPQTPEPQLSPKPVGFGPSAAEAGPSASPAAAAAASGPGDPVSDLADDDLDDLDALLNDLEQTLDEEVSTEDQTLQEAESDDHLEEIDNLLDMDEDTLDDMLKIPTPAATEPEDAVSTMEDAEDGDDLEFELDALDKALDDESEALLAQSGATDDEAVDDLLNDEFDFSDLESLLDDKALEAESSAVAHIEIEGEQVPIEEMAPEAGAADSGKAIALDSQAEEDLSDEFDFSDLESLLDETPEETPQIESAEDSGEEVDLGEELDLSLEAPSEPETEALLDLEDTEGAQDASDEFDFSDLESLIEEPSEAPETSPEVSAVSEEATTASAEELTPESLELGQDDEITAEEEFDLGELDELFGDDADTDLEIPELAEDDLEGPAVEDELDEIEELGIELETQEDEADEESPAEEAAEASAPAEGDEDFDLGDLENVFDMEELTAEAETAGAAGLGISEEHQKDLDELEKLLEIDEEDEGDDLTTVMEDPDAEGDDLQLDLEEIEKTLEAERQKAKAIELETGFDDDSLGLELPAESSPDDDEFALELETSEKEASTAQATPLGDFEIEVESNTAEMAETATERSSTASFSLGDAELVEEHQTPRPTPPKQPTTAIPTAPLPPRSSSRLPLVLILLLVILAGAVVVLDRLGIEVPYVHRTLKNVPGINALFTPEAPDAGNLKLAARVADSRFVENSQAGRLFVIKGNISNGYSQPRTRIAITGKLFAAAADPVQTQTIMGGNVLPDTELGTLPIAEIQQRLNQASTAIVEPGRTLPFMIVFADLPESLREYTVEVMGSSPAQ